MAPKTSLPWRWILVGVVLLGLAAGAFDLWWGFVHARDEAQLTACLHNMKNVDTALQMYAGDSHGQYPRDLAQLTPNYFKVIPTCPAVGPDSYAYQVSPTFDAYTVVCSGSNHAAMYVDPDHPRATSRGGVESGQQNVGLLRKFLDVVRGQVPGGGRGQD